MSTKEKVLEEVLVEEGVSFNNEIVLYNDDVNTFDHVIDTLIRVCRHTSEQAEQCSLIVHYNGKCTVKTGTGTSVSGRQSFPVTGSVLTHRVRYTNHNHT